MIIFPWLITILFLVLIAELVLVLPEVSRSLYKTHRLSAHRPVFRTVMVLTVIQLVLVIAWALTEGLRG